MEPVTREQKRKALVSIVLNGALIVAVVGGLIWLVAGSILQGAIWMVLIVVALIAWGVLRPRR